MTEAEKKVRERWPDAHCYHWGGWRDGEEGFTVRTKPNRNSQFIESQYLGTGETAAAAWADAAKRLEEQQHTPKRDA